MSGVQISKARLEQLERQASKLDALEAGGVDNWEWYDESLSDWHKENERAEKMQTLVEELSVALLEGCYEPSERGAGYCATDEALEEAVKILYLSNVQFGEEA